MTLTEFLLARIAEDEQRATDLPDGGTCWECGTRVKAECEAKRRIVNMEESYEDAYVTAVRALATVYAEHPDYREEWKP